MYIHKYDVVARKFFAVKTKGEIKCLISTTYIALTVMATAADSNADAARHAREVLQARKDRLVRKGRRGYRARLVRRGLKV